MAASNEQLIVNLSARMTDLERQMRRAGQLADDAAKGMEDKFERVNPQFAGLKTAFAGVAGILGGLSFDRLFQSFREANQELIKLGDTAKLTGVSLNTLAGIQFLGRGEGVDAEKIRKGLEGLGSLLNEARLGENELTKLLDANNIKYKDRNGQIIETNAALDIASRLIQNAATEFDKIKIAEALGLTREWVPLLERGPAAFREAVAEANRLGATLDRDTIQKAKEFEDAWTQGWATFVTKAKAALAEAARGIDEYNRRAAAEGLFGWMGRGNLPPRDSDLRPGETGGQPRGSLRDPGTAEYVAELERQNAIRGGAPLTGGVTIRPRRDGGSGSGEETTDADKAQARLERYIETLTRQEAVEKAIADTIGQSAGARQAAIEIAKAQVDLAKLDEETRKKITEQLTAQVKKLEEQREATRRLQQVQQSYNDLLRFAGNSAIDALDRMIVGGQSFGQVVGDITRQLARMLLQAALLGQGPLAALLGLGGTGGGVGGLLGSLISGFRASGGPVSAGGTYVVGEEGPELFRPSTSGMIVPNDVARRGAGVAVSMGDTIIDARGSQLTERQFRAILADERAQTLRLVPDAVKQAQQNRRL